MKELEDIVKAYDTACRQGLKTALATVVHVEGSSYRQPGARMLVTENGQLTGAISGGCLEGDALRKAQLAIIQQRTVLVTYDTTNEDDAQLGVELGCNGIIHILLEPIEPTASQHPVMLLKQVISKRQHTVLVTLFSIQQKHGPQPGTSLLIDDSGGITHHVNDKALLNAITTDALQALQSRQQGITTYISRDNSMTALLAFMPPVPHLVVAGAGNDTMPLIKMAHLLGWHTTLVDGRPAYVTRTRFPEATHLIAAKPAQVITHFTTDAYTAAILMTHNYNYDLALLKELLPLPLPYIGLLGPARKRDRMLAELDTDILQRQHIYGPAGLDIGAETAEEIALSVISEIKSVLSAAAGNSLREKDTAIHSRTQQMITQQFI
ncbi:MAG TPA: XdhC family protein [Chitinophaga sp.]|uniref:XdhC family protein n=1 Tax=Chitinophaga sp. TaxID=1869181 RepID=UPI002CAB1C80|nr:XdhC family protein [Chitinophaga sp.]HVI47657.1 XdhC family protein [Chitinophaga sp.]